MNRILWEKWKDPMLPPVKKGAKVDFEPKDDDEDIDLRDAVDSFGGRDDEDDFDDYPGGGNGPIGPCVAGPHGIIPINESNLPSTLFNFWMGHTNFDLSEPMVEAIEAVPGVETLDVFSRYRFRLGIGRAFNQQGVKDAINAVVLEQEKPAKKEAGPIGIESVLAKKFPFWAVAYFSAQEPKGMGGATKQEVETKLMKIADKAERVVVSWERK